MVPPRRYHNKLDGCDLEAFSSPLLTGGFLVRVQAEEPISKSSISYGRPSVPKHSASNRKGAAREIPEIGRNSSRFARRGCSHSSGVALFLPFPAPAKGERFRRLRRRVAEALSGACPPSRRHPRCGQHPAVPNLRPRPISGWWRAGSRAAQAAASYDMRQLLPAQDSGQPDCRVSSRTISSRTWRPVQHSRTGSWPPRPRRMGPTGFGEPQYLPRTTRRAA